MVGGNLSLEKMIKKYLITTAQRSATPNYKLLENLDKKAERESAEILILPTAGKSIKDEILHPHLQKNYTIIDGDFKLNNNIRISDFQIRPQQINPLTGIKRFAQGDKSFIFASPKQHLEYVANSYDAIPKAVMTTGACTRPRYNEKVRTGRIGKKDHQYGFVEVEIISNSRFQFRHIKSLTNGSFEDLDGLYKEGKFFKRAQGVKAMVLGDIHHHYLNKEHNQASLEQINHLKPKNIFLHDTFDGTSISHHYKGHNIKMFQMAKTQGLDLSKELEDTARYLKTLLSKVPKSTNVYMVASNHDEHLYRYLDEGRFIGDKGNDLIGSKLYTASLEGYNPLMVGISMFMEIPENLKYIERNEGLTLLGYQMGHHGDIGSNGARGSMRSIEEANGKSFTGHTHSAKMFRDTYVVGTSTDLRIGYNIGYSNWTNTNGVLFENGKGVLLNTVKGSWRGV